MNVSFAQKAASHAFHAAAARLWIGACLVFMATIAVQGAVFTVTSTADPDIAESTLNPAKVQPGQAGIYGVVGQLPLITAQPQGQGILPGAAIGLTVSAAGAPPLSYQWFFQETNALSGATNATLNLTNVQPSQAGRYQVVVRNAYGSVTSQAAMLTLQVGRWPAMPRGISYSVVVAGNYAYVADGEAGLQVIDVSNPVKPVRVGVYDTSGSANGVALAGNYVYVADGGAGLQVIDVSNPASPVRVGGYDTSGSASGVALAGNYAYVADGGAGLLIINVNNPASPVRVGGYDTSGYAYGVAVAGNYAYVADGSAGLQVIDLSNPANPVRVGGYDTSGTAMDVAVAGNYAYAADGTNGLQVINVSNPANPVRIGGYNTSGTARGVAVAGNYAYVADDNGGLQVINVSNPANPVRVGGYNTIGYAQGVAVAGNYVYVAADEAGLLVIDVSNPASPVRRGAYDTNGYANSVKVAGNYAYVADSFAGLQVIDISDPVNPVRVGRYDTSGGAHGVALAGNYAYVADESAGLQVIDLSNPANPVRVGGYDTSGNAMDVVVAGNYAYVADYASGLQVINVSNPANPVRVGGFVTGHSARSVAVAGNYAYVAASTVGMQVIDVINPAKPVLAGGYDTSGASDGIALAGNYAYLADNVAGLQVVDVSNPTNPVWVGVCDTTTAFGVAVAGNYAYVADGSAGLQVIDVSNPANPLKVGGYNTTGSASAVALAGNYAFVADGRPGMVILQIAPSPIPPPSITLLSTNQTAYAGSNVMLRVTAEGVPPFAYQWRKDGVNVPNATNDTLVFNPVKLTDAGAYSVVVSNAYGAVTSQVARVAVQQTAPTFTRQPQSQQLQPGDSLKLEVEANGAGPFTYQWRKNGMNIEGATNAVFEIAVLQPGDGGSYTVVVSNGTDTLESDPAVVELGIPLVNMTDAFADRPLIFADQALSGFGRTDNAAASPELDEPLHMGKVGGKSLWLSWRAPADGEARFTTAGSSFDTLLAVYTNTVLTNLQTVVSDEDRGGYLTSLVKFNARQDQVYQVAVDGFAGATGTVVLVWEFTPKEYPLPEILTNSSSQLVALGQPLTLRVEAVGVSQYQWYRSGQALAGETNGVLSRAAVVKGDAGVYWARLTGLDGRTMDSADLVVEVASQGTGMELGLSTDKLEDLFTAGAQGRSLLRERRQLSAGPGFGTYVRYGDWTHATRSPSDPNAPGVIGRNTRWYRLEVEAPAVMTLSLATLYSQSTPILGIYTDRFQLKLVAQDVGKGDHQADVYFRAQPGVAYYVMMDSVEGTAGDYEFQLTAADYGLTEDEENLTHAMGFQQGHFFFEGRVPPGEYWLDGGTDLRNWQSLMWTNISSGVIQFTDPEPASASMKFYRLIRVK